MATKKPKKRAHGKGAKPTSGAITLNASCNQTVTGRVTGTVTELVSTKPRHGKRRTKRVRFQLSGVAVALTAGVVRHVSMKVPPAAVAELQKGRKESAVFRLVATNANGTTTATAAIGALRH